MTKLTFNLKNTPDKEKIGVGDWVLTSDNRLMLFAQIDNGLAQAIVISSNDANRPYSDNPIEWSKKGKKEYKDFTKEMIYSLIGTEKYRKVNVEIIISDNDV